MALGEISIAALSMGAPLHVRQRARDPARDHARGARRAVEWLLGGRIDQFIQRCADVLFTLPGLVLAMAIVTMLGPSMLNVVIAIAIPRLPSTNRVIRSAVLSTKESLYVEASRAIGCNPWRIMLRHLLPNVTAPLLSSLRPV